MLDTIKVGLSDYEVKNGSQITIQPSSYNAGSKEKLSNFRLYVDKGTGEVVEGSKAYFNDSKYNVTFQPYGYGTYCHVSLSVPKYFTGENYNSVGREITKEVFKDLESKLKDLGIHTNINESWVSRIDLFKNIITEESFNNYCGVLSLLGAKRTQKREYGTTFLWSNTQQEYCTYDKLREMAFRKEDVTPYPENTMRFEMRLKNARKVKNTLGYETVGDLLREYGHLREVYLFSMKSNLFKYEVSDIEVMCGNMLESQLRVFKETFQDKYYRSRFLKAYGLMYLLSLTDFETIKETFCKVQGNRMAKYRIEKDLNEIRINATYLQEENDSIRTYSQLYNEMKEKVLKVA